MAAIELEYQLRYMGLNVGTINFTQSAADSTIIVTGKSAGVGAWVKDFDYHMQVNYRGNFLPVTYHKKVHQSDYKEDRTLHFDHSQLLVNRLSNLGNTKTYKVAKDTRDFFSSFFYLWQQVAQQPGVKSFSLNVDAAATQVRVQAKFVGCKTISTAWGKIKTNCYRFDFYPQTGPKERSDMLTNKMRKSSNHLYFWFGVDPPYLPYQLQYEESPFSTWWKLKKTEQ